jgi:putative flippase GtrA
MLIPPLESRKKVLLRMFRIETKSSFTNRLYSRNIMLKKIKSHHVFAKYVLFGLLNTSVGYVIYAIAIFLGLSFQLANLTSLIFGLLLSYKTQSKFVFKKNGQSVFIKYLLCWSLIYIIVIHINGFFLAIVANTYISGALVLPFSVLSSYFIQRYFVFKER